MSSKVVATYEKNLLILVQLSPSQKLTSSRDCALRTTFYGLVVTLLSKAHEAVTVLHGWSPRKKNTLGKSSLTNAEVNKQTNIRLNKGLRSNRGIIK